MGSTGDPITVLPGRTTEVGKIMLEPLSSPWKIYTIGSSVEYGECDKGGENTSIAIGPEDQSVHISYYDYDNLSINYATNGSGDWDIVPLISYGYGYSSIAVDREGYAHVGYLNYPGLYYATNESGSWDISVADNGSNGSVVNSFTSTAVTSKGTPYIIYIVDYDRDTIEIFNDGGGFEGNYASIALDSSDFIHISYYDDEKRILGYASNSDNGTWFSRPADTANSVGEYTSIAVDQKDSSAHISYYDANIGDLKYATNANPADTASKWIVDRVDEVGGVGLYTSIALDASGIVHITYYDFENGNLKYAKGVLGCWVTDSMDTLGDVGLYTSVAIDSKDNLHISYYDLDNCALKYATKEILR
jgi:hypothetical protein